MSQMIDFTLPSSAPGRMLHAFRCVPEGEVRAIVQLSHGMVEFIDRYKPLAEYLAARGILVTGNDHLGHGGKDRQHPADRAGKRDQRFRLETGPQDDGTVQLTAPLAQILPCIE